MMSISLTPTSPMHDRPQLGDWKSWDELRELQEARFAEIGSWAAASPFYRNRGVESLDAGTLGSLSFTSKSDLRNAYPFGMLGVERRRLATYHESSGTSGMPTPSYYTEEDWLDLNERYARKWVEIREDDTMLVRTPYALMISGHLAQAAARSRGATVVPGDNRSLAMPYSRVVRALHDLDVTLTWSMATETLIWAAATRLAGHQPGVDFPHLRALFVGGDTLSAARRRRIEAIWQVPVVEEYGSTETGSLAGACPHGSLHLWADRVLFEVFNSETGRVTAEGRGQLVVTPLYREAMPLLRYNLEDEVEVSYDPCACGWLLPTVKVFGRSAFVHHIDGRPVTQDILDDLVFSLPESYGVMFWRAKVGRDSLHVQMEAAADTAASASRDLTDMIHERLNIRPEVEAVRPGSLVPHEALTAHRDVVKPRNLFGPNDDWNKALTYY